MTQIIQNVSATIQTAAGKPVAESRSSSGCLVKIYPLELENKLLRIAQRKTTIGRQATNDVFCDDVSISREHAMIVKNEIGFVLRDLGSTNGTFVNGQQLSEKILSDGDKIQVGNHIFKFLAGDSIESQYHETVYSMMTMDGLTNVYNKRYLLDALSREFERSTSYDRPFSVVMIDIDRFKDFNDQHGHLAGDELLQQFAARIQSLAGKDQIFARFGGEEFVWLMIETAKQKAIQLAESARELIASTPFCCCAGNLHVTASFGVAEVAAERHVTFADLLEESDQRLYEAKTNGRNQVCPS